MKAPVCSPFYYYMTLSVSDRSRPLPQVPAASVYLRPSALVDRCMALLTTGAISD